LLGEHDRARTRLQLAEQALAEARAQFDGAANAHVPPEITVAWAALAAAHGLPAEGPDAPLVARLRAARERGRLARRLAQIRARTEEMEVKRRRHGEEALALALEAGIPQAEPELAIAALRRLLKQASEAQARRPDLEAALAAAERDVGKAERDVKDAEALRRKLDDGTRRFAAWRMAVRAPADLSPAGALGWVKALREATAAAESARSASAEIGLARNDLARMRAAVDAVATDLGEPSVQDDEEGVARIHEWKRRLDAARTARTALGE